MKTASYWIDHLDLQQHPEGGFYKETYRSPEHISIQGLPARFFSARSFSTAIYFLLRSEDRSLFHRIKSDELWHYHAGGSLTLFVIDNGKLVEHKLGAEPEKGESLQVAIPANCWFGAMVNETDSYVLAGCTVAPGFDFADFELADRSSLLAEYPNMRDVIEKLAH